MALKVKAVERLIKFDKNSVGDNTGDNGGSDNGGSTGDNGDNE